MSGSKAMSLKAKIRNLAKNKKIPAQVVLQNYIFERFLNRLSVSEYKEKVILKGGVLVANIVGLDNRATMDLDTTLKNFPLILDKIENMVDNIISINLDDDIVFTIKKITPIREEDFYGGYRVFLNASYDTIIVPITIDISTGDVITPNPVKINYKTIFDEQYTFEILAYNIETILAEKTETILRRSVFNTRPRDFYDIYILAKTQSYNKKVFLEALNRTIEHRKTEIKDYKLILDVILKSDDLKKMWKNYQSQFEYAKEIEYEDLCNVIKILLSNYED